MSDLICTAASYLGINLDHCQPATDKASGGKPKQTVARNEDPQARSFLEKLLFGTETAGGAVGCTRQKGEPSRETNEAVPPPRKDQPKVEEDESQKALRVQSLLIDLGSPDKNKRLIAAIDLYELTKGTLSSELIEEMVDPLITASKDNESESVQSFAVRTLEKLRESYPSSKISEIRLKIAIRLAEYQKEGKKPKTEREFDEIMRTARGYQREGQAIFDEAQRITEEQRGLGEQFRRDLRRSQLEHDKLVEDVSRQVDRPGRAENCSREALEANSKGMDSLRKGLVVSAKSWFERAINIDGNCVPAHVNLAAIYFNEQDFLKAKSHSEKALKVDPNQPKALYLLAGTLYGMAVFDPDPKPRLREAKVHIEKAARLNPDQPDILELQRSILEALGENR